MVVESELLSSPLCLGFLFLSKPLLFILFPSLSLSPLSSLSPAPSLLRSLQPLLATSLSDSNVSGRREACLSLLIHAVYPGLVNLSNNSRTWHRDGLAGNRRLRAAHDSRR